MLHSNGQCYSRVWALWTIHTLLLLDICCACHQIFSRALGTNILATELCHNALGWLHPLLNPCLWAWLLSFAPWLHVITWMFERGPNSTNPKHTPSCPAFHPWSCFSPGITTLPVTRLQTSTAPLTGPDSFPPETKSIANLLGHVFVTSLHCSCYYSPCSGICIL